MARESREVWSRRVTRWRDGELSANEFAKEIGVNPNTFKHWAWRLGASDASKPRRARGQEPASERRPRSARVEFVEVALPDGRVDEAARERAMGAFELALDGRRILRVPPDFDVGALRRLLAVLEAG
ncbi:MAG: hypothetical protein IT307_09805 [Chloroflexi bacterium]|nr:hypothetical protein [Chloroflexota bacterium]